MQAVPVFDAAHEDEARRYIDWGYTFVAGGSDVGFGIHL